MTDDDELRTCMKHGRPHEQAYGWHVWLFVGSCLAMMASFFVGWAGGVAAGLLCVGSGIMAIRAGRSIIGWVHLGSATIHWLPEPDGRSGLRQTLHAYVAGLAEILLGIWFIVLSVS